MRNWLTYSISCALGVAFYFLFGNYPWFGVLTAAAADIMLSVSSVLLIVVVFTTLSAAVASFAARRDIGLKTFLLSLLWGVGTTLLLSIAASLAFLTMPAAVPATFPPEDFRTAFLSNTIILKVLSLRNITLAAIAAAVITGYAVRPTSSIFGPIYSIANSLSEVSYRLCLDLSRFWWLPLFFMSARWTSVTVQSGFSGNWLSTFFIFALIAVFGLLPLAYFAATGFRHNPYSRMFRLLPAALPAFLSGGFVFAAVPFYTTVRNNLGVQKRVTALTAVESAFFAKGGSAACATLFTCFVLFGPSSLHSGLARLLPVALSCSLFSIICSMAPGSEILFISVYALNYLGSGSVPVSPAMAALPLFAGTAALINALSAGLAADVCSVNLKAGTFVYRKDMI